jgi:hypothetical protein
MIEDDTKKEPSAKRAYEPPAIEQEDTFETLALACAKAAGPSCVVGGVNS